jgi:hypothetical protein
MRTDRCRLRREGCRGGGGGGEGGEGEDLQLQPVVFVSHGDGSNQGIRVSSEVLFRQGSDKSVSGQIQIDTSKDEEAKLGEKEGVPSFRCA